MGRYALVMFFDDPESAADFVINHPHPEHGNTRLVKASELAFKAEGVWGLPAPGSVDG